MRKITTNVIFMFIILFGSSCDFHPDDRIDEPTSLSTESKTAVTTIDSVENAEQKYIGTYKFDYQSDTEDFPEDHYIVIELIAGKLFGRYYGTSDDFDSAREGYTVGYFVVNMSNLSIENGLISFELTPSKSDLFSNPIDLKYKSSMDIPLDENPRWINSHIFDGTSREYSGSIEDEKISLDIFGDSRVLLKEVSAEGKWTFVEDEHYCVVPIQLENPLLVKQLQDRDHLAIWEKQSKISNWEEAMPQIIGEQMRIRPLDDTKSCMISEFDVDFDTSSGMKTIQMNKIIQGESIITLPKLGAEYSLAGFSITPDGQKSFVISDKGLWTVNNETNQLEPLLLSTYNDYSFEDLVSRSYEVFGGNYVTWNSNVMPDLSGTKLAYISNKHDVEYGRNALYVYDLTTKVETMIASSEIANYFNLGWLDAEHIFCVKNRNDGISYVSVNLNGEETPFNFSCKEPIIYSVQNQLIAYMEDWESNQIIVIKYMDDSPPQVIKIIEIDEQAIFRGEMKCFSPDNSQIACLYSPDRNERDRYIQVVNLNSQKSRIIDSLPKDCDYILEFFWMDNNTLLVVTGNGIDGKTELSTWTYSLLETQSRQKSINNLLLNFKALIINVVNNNVKYIEILAETKLVDETETEESENPEVPENDSTYLSAAELNSFELLRADWTTDQMEELGLQKDINEPAGETTYFNDVIKYVYSLYFSETPLLFSVTVLGPCEVDGPRGISIGDTFEEVLTLFPQEKDWEKSLRGEFYGLLYEGAERQEPTGYVHGSNGMKTITITTARNPWIRFEFKDDILVSYSISLMSGD